MRPRRLSDAAEKNGRGTQNLHDRLERPDFTDSLIDELGLRADKLEDDLLLSDNLNRPPSSIRFLPKVKGSRALTMLDEYVRFLRATFRY